MAGVLTRQLSWMEFEYMGYNLEYKPRTISVKFGFYWPSGV
jgi:hypothetical protein